MRQPEKQNKSWGYLKMIYALCNFYYALFPKTTAAHMINIKQGCFSRHSLWLSIAVTSLLRMCLLLH